METRQATGDDREAVGAIARRSFEASYSLSPRTIEDAVTEWYGEDPFGERLADEAVLLTVLEEGGEIRGFAESVLVAEGGDGDLLWLHVDPDYRGEGFGRALFEGAHEELAGMGAERLRAKVLEDNAAGNDFYANHGFEMVDTDTVEIDGDRYVENIYVEAGTTEPLIDPEAAPTVPTTVTTADGRETYIDAEEVERGSKGPFLTTYGDPEREEKFGYFCTNCESLDNAMDSMGRVRCNGCGNLRKATRWDSTQG